MISSWSAPPQCCKGRRIALYCRIRRSGGDCLVSLGGGSPIDMYNVASYSTLTGSDLTTARQLIEGVKPGAHTGRELIHIAIPTTWLRLRLTALDPHRQGFEVRFDSMNPQPAALDRRPCSAQALEQSQVMDRPLSREGVVTLLEAAY
jgi:hypothetical protein